MVADDFFIPIDSEVNKNVENTDNSLFPIVLFGGVITVLTIVSIVMIKKFK